LPVAEGDKARFWTGPALAIVTAPANGVMENAWNGTTPENVSAAASGPMSVLVVNRSSAPPGVIVVLATKRSYAVNGVIRVLVTSLKNDAKHL
jgi:hypothetical protein